MRMNHEHADATLGGLGSRHRHAMLASPRRFCRLRYALPTLPFVARPKGRRRRASSAIRTRSTASSRRSTPRRAARTARGRGLSFEHPHFTAATTTAGSRTRRRLTVALCGDARGGGRCTASRCSGTTTRPRGARAYRHLAEAGIPRLARLAFRDVQRGSLAARAHDRRHPVGAAGLRSLHRTARRVRAQRRKERNSLPFMPASAVRPGMVMIDERGEYDVVERVERVELDEPVYDLDVERTHNFIANGLADAQLDLRLPRSRHPQHPRVRARLPGDAHDRARAELPLHERDPRGRERGDREQLGAEGEAALVGARRRRSGAGDRGGGRAGRVALRGGADRRPRRGGLHRQRDRDLLPDERAVAGASSRRCACTRSPTR